MYSRSKHVSQKKKEHLDFDPERWYHFLAAPDGSPPQLPSSTLGTTDDKTGADKTHPVEIMGPGPESLSKTETVAPTNTDVASVNTTNTSTSTTTVNTTSPSTSTCTTTSTTTSGSGSADDQVGEMSETIPNEIPAVPVPVDDTPAANDLDDRYLTFFTRFLPFSLREACACVNFYQRRYNRKQDLTLEDLDILAAIEKKLDTALSDPAFARDGAFVRLSSRSPKDGDPFEDTRSQEYSAAVKPELASCTTPEEELQAKLRVLFSCRSQLCCKRGRDAMSLILSSERVFVDLLLDLDNAKIPGDVWMTCFSVRRWEPRLTEDMEFRTFVCGGKITAISQYNQYCLYPHLQSKKEVISASILEFWSKEIKHRIPHSQYVIDFGILSTGRVIVVELNPFATTTGAALFTWERERTLLENGPFELRLRTTPLAPETTQQAIQMFTQAAEHAPTYKDLMETYRKQLNPTTPAPPPQPADTKPFCSIC
ncbi:cell division cycle protein 123-like [Pelomyxa schiedti]|nr:cell division cycle protein 123-like [Pelomyxa schiedti]